MQRVTELGNCELPGSKALQYPDSSWMAKRLEEFCFECLQHWFLVIYDQPQRG